MEVLFFRVVVVSAAVSLVLLPLLLMPGWRRRYAPHTRRAVWLGIAVVLLAAPLLPKSQAPVQLTVPASATAVPTRTSLSFRHVIVPAQPSFQETEEAEGASPETHRSPAAAWGTILAVLWLAGGAAVLLWQGTAYGLARRRLLRGAVPLTGFEELAAELCPRRSVRFFRVDGLDTPMTLGIFRPAVLLPGGEDCQAALRHELIHIRRWDVGWKALVLLSCAVHWFNPLVWLMSRRADRDMEAGCDAAVVAGGDAAERRSYGELLLRTAAGQSIPLTTRFGGGKRLMKERLYDLFHPGKKSRLLVGAVLLLCLLAGGLVACRSGEQTPAQAIQELQESVSVENGVLSFVIPKNYSSMGDWNIHIAGRMEAEGLGGMSLHYLEGEAWEEGKTYTLDITPEQWEGMTELNMDVLLGEESRTINLLAAMRGIADGIYCAPAPNFMETDWETDPERWEFTLMKYDPESGERGAALDTVVLPLAEDLLLQRLGDESPFSAGEAGTSTRERRIANHMMWPHLRSSILPPNQSDMLEVHIRNGEVTLLKWFLAPVAEGAGGEDADIYGEDGNIYTVTGGSIHTFTGEAAGGSE